MKTKLITVGLTAALTAVLAADLTVHPAFAQSVILTLDDGPCAIPLQANSSVSVDAATGNLTLDVDDGNLPTCFGTPGGALEVVVTATPDTINAGAGVSVTWSVTGYIEGVTQCTATGGTPRWINEVAESEAGGSGDYFPDGNTTFSLSCQNSGGSDSVAVTVNGGSSGGIDGFPPPPAFCGPEPAGRALPFNIFKDFQSNPPDGTSKVNFEDVWSEFPGTNEATVFVPVQQYVAMPFISNQAAGKVWEMRWVGGPSNGNATTVSISRCPGDFSGVGYSDPLCKTTSGSEGSALFTIVGAGGSACPLESGSNEVYYLNVRHTNSVGTNACFEGGQCGFLGVPRELN